MTEASLKSDLVRLLRHELLGSIVFRHEDKLTSGIPDISVTWRGMTVWLEAKFLNPSFYSKGIQTLTLRRLASAGHCFYVLYRKEGTKFTTNIIGPHSILENVIEGGEWTSDGINHQLIVDFLKNHTKPYHAR
jgi:hypothetical protein